MNMLSRLFILALWIYNLIRLRIRASALQGPETRGYPQHFKMERVRGQWLLDHH